MALDTEEVFCSYVYYRHQQAQAEGAITSPDPKMVMLPLEPSSTMGQVGQKLAIMGTTSTSYSRLLSENSYENSYE